MATLRSILTINSIDRLNNDSLDQFIKDGFAYVRLSRSSIEKALWKLHKEAISFFDQPIQQKEKDGIKLDPKTLQGYIDRRKEKNKNPILHEQIFFRPQNPLGPFIEYQSEINEVHNAFWNEIGQPLLKSVFNRILMKMEFTPEKINSLFSEAIDDIFSSISLLHYPYTQQPELYECGLNEHTDQGLITILWINQESLQVWLETDADGEWHDINPKEGYVIVNIGNALQAILGGCCKSALHRVLTPKAQRLSIAIFYDPSANYKMRNIIENKLLFGGSCTEFMKDHFSKSYSPTFEKILDEK